ncbi:hypothetical protein [Streptomyces catenulae]|uniref:Uncharacterized protein n=1 Tax=Streptomyces catenulae TaxID=66875 RepID=A0ABV2YXM9_9ACTN|nr:hypothetical protein [Streptomyces catenulae]
MTAEQHDFFGEFEAYVVGREAARWQAELDRRLARLGEQLADVAAQAAVELPEAGRAWFLRRVREVTTEARAGG